MCSHPLCISFAASRRGTPLTSPATPACQSLHICSCWSHRGEPSSTPLRSTLAAHPSAAIFNAHPGHHRSNKIQVMVNTHMCKCFCTFHCGTGVRVPVVLAPSLATLQPPLGKQHQSSQPLGEPVLGHSHAPPRSSSRAAKRRMQHTTCQRVLSAAATCLSPGMAPLQVDEQQAVEALLHEQATDVEGAHDHVDHVDLFMIDEQAERDDMLSLPDVTAALCAQLEGLHQAAVVPPTTSWSPRQSASDRAAPAGDGIQEALQLKQSIRRLSRLGDDAQLLLLLEFLLQAPAPTYGALHGSQIAAAVKPLTTVRACACARAKLCVEFVVLLLLFPKYSGVFCVAV